jgi:hypothetical protein
LVFLLELGFRDALGDQQQRVEQEHMSLGIAALCLVVLIDITLHDELAILSSELHLLQTFRCCENELRAYSSAVVTYLSLPDDAVLYLNHLEQVVGDTFVLVGLGDDHVDVRRGLYNVLVVGPILWRALRQFLNTVPTLQSVTTVVASSLTFGVYT